MPIKELIIGFDFGTSCSKVVVRDNGRSKSYAIPLSENNNPYLIATEIFRNENEEISLSQISKKEEKKIRPIERIWEKLLNLKWIDVKWIKNTRVHSDENTSLFYEKISNLKLRVLENEEDYFAYSACYMRKSLS